MPECLTQFQIVCWAPHASVNPGKDPWPAMTGRGLIGAVLQLNSGICAKSLGGCDVLITHC